MVEILLLASLFFLIVIFGLQLYHFTHRDTRSSEQYTLLLEKVREIEWSLREEFAQNRQESSLSFRLSREELAQSMKTAYDTLNQQVGILIQTTDKKLDMLREALEQRLKAIEENNLAQLERIRLTVDEKLQGTLETKLGESFRLVSERLEQVYRGLGEMQRLAAGVGDLKKVLTNVKTRGIWGEVQLGAMLETVLTPEQFARNVVLKEGTRENVEYAVILPGPEEGATLYLPIDAKFPLEDYYQLLAAQEKGEIEKMEAAGKQIEHNLKKYAEDIARKYLNPPVTTDFAILFLPTEGLFAEAMKRPGLAEYLQQEKRIMLAGPTTLWALLTSLQMGFKTLAIQKRTSEVWQLLAAIKTEWSKFGDLLDKVQKKLTEASKTIDEAQTKTRIIERKLKEVEELPSHAAEKVLSLTGGKDEES